MKEILNSSYREKTKSFYVKEINSALLRLFSILAIATLGLNQFVLEPVRAESELTLVTANEQDTSPEIYNGRLANEDETAFSIFLSSGENKKCSGVILSEHIISTALHCVLSKDGHIFNPSKVFVYLAGDQSQQAFKVKEIREIGAKSPSNDRVILLLARPITFNDTVKPIKIGTNEMKYKEGLYAIGHGFSEESPFSWIPRVGKQTYKHNSERCTAPSFIVTKNVDENNQAVVTHGDSGGGLFVYIPEGDPDFEEGYYILGTTTSFCSSDLYDENGKVNPYYEVGFQSIFFDSIQEEINKAIEETSLWPAPPKFFLPSIKLEKNRTLLPQIRN